MASRFVRPVQTLALPVMALLVLGGCQKRDEAPAAQPQPAPASEKTSAPAAAVPVSGSGLAASGESYEIHLEAPKELTSGTAGELALKVVARGEFHINAEYPHAFRPAEATGVSFAEKKFDLKDGAETAACKENPKDACSLSKRVPFQANAAGAQKLEGVVAFSVCTAEVCLIEKVPVSAALTVR